MRFALAILLLSALSCRAATFNALSSSRADVGDAYALCSDGDTLAIPAGTSSWTNTLTVTIAITIQGAGIGQTILLDDIVDVSGPTEAMFYFDTLAGKSYRLTGVEMRIGTRATSNFAGLVQLVGTSTSIRLDHNRWDRIKNAGIYASGGTLGCVDNNDFNATVNHTIATRNHQLYSSSFGYGSWETPIVPGSDQAWYYEDNTFTGDDSDCFGGGRAVWRFNTFTNSLIHSHGTESSGNYRACRWQEIYGNTYVKTIVDSREFIDIRDGGGLIVSNTIILQGAGTSSTMIGLNNYRMWGPYTIWGGADGTNPLDLNDVAGGIYATGLVTTGTSGTGIPARTITDTNQSWTVDQWKGYTLRNMSSNYPTAYPYTSNYFSQIVSNSATTITYYEHATSLVMRFLTNNAYEIRRVLISLDQPGSGDSDVFHPVTNPFWPNQAREPIYQWSNTNAGSTVLITSGQGNVVDGRDYTNQVVHPTWTPFTYPHPLRNEGGDPPNAAPSNLVATAFSSTQIDLTWTDNSTNELSFLIERSLTSGSGFSNIYTSAADSTSYSNTGLTPSTTYYYRVRASNSGGYSAYSNEDSATTSAAPGGGGTTFASKMFKFLGF